MNREKLTEVYKISMHSHEEKLNYYAHMQTANDMRTSEKK